MKRSSKIIVKGIREVNMARSWERFIAAEEAAHTSECYEHARSIGITDPMKFMDVNKILSCDEMPCSRNCPFNVTEVINERV